MNPYLLFIGAIFIPFFWVIGFALFAMSQRADDAMEKAETEEYKKHYGTNFPH